MCWGRDWRCGFGQQAQGPSGLLDAFTRVLDAVGLAELVAKGEALPAELEAAAREAVQAVDPRINAVVETWRTDDEPVPGSTPLAGVPFLIKDIAVAMAGRRMELGSRLAAGNVVGADSSLMQRFRRAGLVTFGRTATPEMAYGISTESALYGSTRNPWDLERSAGGSSGGAAAAVAAGVVPVAHGALRRRGLQRPGRARQRQPHRTRQCGTARPDTRPGVGRPLLRRTAVTAVRGRSHPSSGLVAHRCPRPSVGRTPHCRPGDRRPLAHRAVA